LALLLGGGGFTSLSRIFRHGKVMLSMISGLRTSTDIINSVITTTKTIMISMMNMKNVRLDRPVRNTEILYVPTQEDN